MPTTVLYPVLTLIAALIVLALVYPSIQSQKQYDEVRALARMGRYARRYDTLLRRYEGIPFVVVNHMSGFRYMYQGQMVNREQLLKALGPKSEKTLQKIEQEESMRPPRPTMLTQLLSRNPNKAG